MHQPKPCMVCKWPSRQLICFKVFTSAHPLNMQVSDSKTQGNVTSHRPGGARDSEQNAQRRAIS